MKLTSKILEDANLSLTHFARLAHVHVGTVDRYFIGTNKKPECVNKIELAAQVIVDNEFVWPDIAYKPSGTGYKIFIKNKKKSDSLDKKFETAFKKAAKAQKLF